MVTTEQVPRASRILTTSRGRNYRSYFTVEKIEAWGNGIACPNAEYDTAPKLGSGRRSVCLQAPDSQTAPSHPEQYIILSHF